LRNLASKRERLKQELTEITSDHDFPAIFSPLPYAVCCFRAKKPVSAFVNKVEVLEAFCYNSQPVFQAQ